MHLSGNGRTPKAKRDFAALLVVDQGRTYEQAAAIAEVGSVQIVKTAVAHELGRRDAPPSTETLPQSSKARLEASLAYHKQRLDAQHKLEVEVAIAKRMDEWLLPLFRQLQDDAKRIVQGRKGCISGATFRKILACLHPDSRGSASDERLAEAFNEFKKLEKLLVDEKDSPTPICPLPRTYEEMLAAKQKAWEARKAKRKRNTTIGGMIVLLQLLQIKKLSVTTAILEYFQWFT